MFSALSLVEILPASLLEEILKDENLEVTDENIFIVASCDKKGVAFLKGDGPLMVRKGKNNQNGEKMAGNYTVVVDGKKYSVQVADGDADIQVSEAPSVNASAPTASTVTATPEVAAAGSTEVHSQTPGNVWKILKKAGDSVAEGEIIMILEAMKMEIDIPSPKSGTIASIDVSVNDVVQDAQLLATIS